MYIFAFGHKKKSAAKKHTHFYTIYFVVRNTGEFKH